MCRLTAKLRGAIPACLLVEGKEIKGYKNIEIPDGLKTLSYHNFKFGMPLNGAIRCLNGSGKSTIATAFYALGPHKSELHGNDIFERNLGIAPLVKTELLEAMRVRMLLTIPVILLLRPLYNNGLHLKSMIVR